MRYILFLLLIINASNGEGQAKKNATKVSDCSSLLKQGYTKEFCSYNQLYKFKGIPFESRFYVVDSLMDLKRTKSWANVYNIGNEDCTDWGITKFTRGTVKFQNGKMICIMLDLIEDKGKVPDYKFEGIKKLLSGIFGEPRLAKTSDESNVWFDWVGTKIEINLIYFGMGGTVSLSICSTKLGSDNTLDNL
jgi:hypothetical protein